MKHIKNCNICGGKVDDILQLPFQSIIGMAENYTQCISICPRCGFIFTRNPFSDEQLENRYKNFSKFEFDSEDYILSETEDYKIRSNRQKQFIERVIGGKKIHSILEIGASSGYNLSLYENCAVDGVEPSSVNCAGAKERYGIEMFCGTFREFAEKGLQKRYDLIFLSHVLEHIVNPCDFIKECAELNNRYIFIEVPTFDYKFVDEPFGMFAEEHVNMFTLEGMQNLMRNCGYELVNADMIFGLEQCLPAGWPAISTLWEKKKKVKIHKLVGKSMNMLKDYIENSWEELARIRDVIQNIDKDCRLAIWGTGHHASMLMANTELVEKNIVRVYDSDKRKEGQLFCGVEIHPFCETDIEKGEVDTILLATYTAQKALDRILEPYKKKVDVIKLYDLD